MGLWLVILSIVVVANNLQYFFFRYELLLQEERTVGQEVSAFDKKLESWLSARDSRPSTVATTGSVPVRESQAPAASSMPPAVVAFEVYMIVI